MQQKISGYSQWPFYLLACISIIGLLAQLPILASASQPRWQAYHFGYQADSRPYFVYTPQHYQLGTAVPLVVMLHGCTQTAADFAAGTHMNQLAEQDNFIVVYPQQVSTANGDECWNWFEPVNQARGSGEAAIIVGIVHTIEQNTARWTIDSNRIYVAGISAGAALSVILGATYPDVFAAIGVHSGFEYQAATSAAGVVQASEQGGPAPAQQGLIAFAAMGAYARIVPTIVFHGSSDAVIHPLNGDQVVQQWMRTDSLASHGTYRADFQHPSTTSKEQVPGGYQYTVHTWNDNGGNEVQEYWIINGMGHAWSGGSYGSSYTDPQGPDASQAMVTFFLSHPMNYAVSL